jgi:hypothetical protein
MFRNPLVLALVILFAGVTLHGGLHLAGQSQVASAEQEEEVGWWMEVVSGSEVDPETGLRSIIVKNPFNGEDEVAYYADTPLANRHPWLVEGHAFVVPRQGFGGGGVYFLKVSTERPPEHLPTTSTEKCLDCVPALYHWSEGKGKSIDPPRDL